MTSSPAISATNLSFRYRGRSEFVFRDLDLSFSRGSFTVVTGASGSGKSTLLSILGLLLAPSGGVLALLGKEMTLASDLERSMARASYIGFLFQDALLDPSRSILSNVMEGGFYGGQRRGVAKETSLELLARVGLQVDGMPARLPRAISGGQAQRVALCRCLVNSPEIIIADEPTGNLDDGTSAVVLDMLDEECSNGATVVVATHDPLVAARASDVLDLS